MDTSSSSLSNGNFLYFAIFVDFSSRGSFPNLAIGEYMTNIGGDGRLLVANFGWRTDIINPVHVSFWAWRAPFEKISRHILYMPPTGPPSKSVDAERKLQILYVTHPTSGRKRTIPPS